jgi:hypothetical protein
MCLKGKVNKKIINITKQKLRNNAQILVSNILKNFFEELSFSNFNFVKLEVK